MAKFSDLEEVHLIMRAQSLFPMTPYLRPAAVRAARRSWVRAQTRHQPHKRQRRDND